MDFEIVIIGAGVIGLAIGRELSKKFKNIIILEKNNSFGLETSSRNSGVLHAGIYYKKNSLKSKFCKTGNKLLSEYAKERKIGYKNCGKLIVASNSDEDLKLKDLLQNAIKNNIKLEYLNKKESIKLEPQLNCFSSLISETTAIIDVHELMNNLIIDIQNNNGTLVYNSEVDKIIEKNKCLEFNLKGEKKKFKTKFIINCAGIFALKLISKIQSFNKKYIPKINLFKGDYFRLDGISPFKRLIYPIPCQNSLGIHSTINFNNETVFGPDEQLIKNISYKISNKKKKNFTNNIVKYWPEITSRTIHPDYSGIRTSSLSNDFIIQTNINHNIPGLINLLGINSPGLTCSLAIGKYIAQEVFNSSKLI